VSRNIHPKPETANDTAVPSPGTTTVAPDIPLQTPAPVPVEMAYLASIQCGVGDRSEATYHCNGNVRIRSGVYDEVMVIARYPDNNTFKSGVLALGGGNPVSGPFVTFPDLKYQGQNPNYFVKLDKTLYPVIWNTGQNPVSGHLERQHRGRLVKYLRGRGSRHTLDGGKKHGNR